MKKMSKRYRKRRRRTFKRYKGGSGGIDPRYTFWPQTIVNLGRDSLAQSQNVMNTMRAYPSVVSPNPMVQPINK